MRTFNITIEEHVSETFEVDAETLEHAMEIAEQQYYNCEFIVGPNITARLMQGADENYNEVTEWVEF